MEIQKIVGFLLMYNFIMGLGLWHIINLFEKDYELAIKI